MLSYVDRVHRIVDLHGSKTIFQESCLQILKAVSSCIYC